jgi:hypothetical protein
MLNLRRVVAAITSVCATCAVGAVASAPRASASLFPRCDEQQTSTPFAGWGDNSSYFAVPGGTFEAATPDWSLAGATIVADNESYHVDSPTDTQSLSLAGDPTGGARVVSPRTCVDLGDDTVRMFVKSSGEADSSLHIQAIVDDPPTGLVFSFGHDIDGGADTTEWSPTPRMLIPNLLGGLLDTANLTLVFTTTGPATWNIDDVYVDPFKSR